MVQARDPFSSLNENLYKRTIKGVKVAIPGILLDEGILASESMTDYIFDQVGGFELLSSARTTTIQSPLNNTPSFIKDSGAQFNSDIIVPASSSLFGTFNSNNINLDDYIPTGYSLANVVTIDDSNMITVVVQNIKENYLIEFRFLYGIESNGIIDSGSDV